ncbi:MAG: DUF4340 domain-containing protein, partial [Clostridia bacterium]|nr:DUF4340 domain-containing protein [Clostridia bacterium]
MSQTPEEKDLLTAQESAAEAPSLPEEEAAPPKKAVAYDESLFEESTVFSKPKEEPKKKGLRPAVKGAILAGIAVVVAGAVGLTVLLLPATNGGSNVPSNMLSAVYGVTEVKEADLVEAKLYNAAGTLRFYPEATEATSSDEEASITWLVEGYEKYNLSGAGMLVGGAVGVSTESRLNPKEGQLLADDYLDRLGSLRYGAEAGEDDESVYGFDRPYAAFCMTGKDGAKTAFIIGDWAPDGSGRYVTATGKDGIYIINDSGYSVGRYSFAATAADLIDSAVVDPVMQNENNADYFVDAGLSLMDDITLSGRSIGTKLVFEIAPEDLAALTYVLTEPSFRATNEDNVDKLFNVASSGFSAAGAYRLGYTEADLAQYGLDNPYVDLVIRVGDWRTHLSFGK